MNIISTDKAPTAVGPYSQAIKINDFLFCSGQVGLDPVTMKFTGNNIESQTTQVLKNIADF